MIQTFEKIEKPTLLLDETTTRKNIQRMAARVRAANIHFRPHFKTHQSAEIGAWFRAEGVDRITVSSVDMALYFAGQGWEDITIAFPANLRQRAALSELARRVHLGLLVESEEAIRQLAQAIDAPAGLWLKVDAGLHRTGLPWDQPEETVRVARAALAAHPLQLRGLLTHFGQTYLARGKKDVCRRYSEGLERVAGLCRALEGQGIGPLEVSVGDTPAASLCADLGAVDEIRPGNFVFYDAQQLQIGSCQWQDIAVALACPVVAVHTQRSEAVIYGGAIHLSKDYMLEGDRRMYGLVSLPDPETGRWGAPLPDAYVSALSQEHGVIRMRPEDLARVQAGDLVCILPAHSCLTVTLMKRYLTLTGKIIETMNV
jgi:D-serine deaminase-like pyridoxal phosphate-dependent protein